MSKLGWILVLNGLFWMGLSTLSAPYILVVLCIPGVVVWLIVLGLLGGRLGGRSD